VTFLFRSRERSSPLSQKSWSKQGTNELTVVDTDSRTRTATHLDAIIPAFATAQAGTYTILVEKLFGSAL